MLERAERTSAWTCRKGSSSLVEDIILGEFVREQAGAPCILYQYRGRKAAVARSDLLECTPSD